NWSIVAIYFWLLRRPADREKFGLAVNRFDYDLFRRLIRYGIPGGLPLLVEALGFSLLIKEVSAIGPAEAAATALAFNVNAIAFVPLIGLGIAVSTLVGQKLGENRPYLAARATWTAVALAVAYTVLFAVPLVGVPHWFVMLHAAGADEAEFAPVRPLAI